MSCPVTGFYTIPHLRLSDNRIASETVSKMNYPAAKQGGIVKGNVTPQAAGN